MKKYLCQFMVALMAVTSFTFVSCSDDEDDPTNNNGGNSGKEIEINGEMHSLSPIVSYDGSWVEEEGGGGFGICVSAEHNGLTDAEYYVFNYKNSSCPKVGDDFGDMSLSLNTLTHNNDYDWDLYDPYHYKSGSAIVTNTSKGDSKITIKFDKLTMENSTNTYCFKGTVTLPFSYDNW